MRSLRSLRRSSRVIREQVGLRRFLKLADPYLEKRIDRLETQDKKENVLIVSPHADDEAIGCGGAFALHNRRGDVVKVVYTTDSARTLKGKDVDPSYAEKRRKESLKSIELVGGATTDHLGLPDGEGATTEDAVNKLKQIISAYGPHRIYVPWALDNHRDHRAAFDLLEKAIEGRELRECAIWQYEVWTPLVPNRILPISSVLKLKENAIRAHESQVNQHDYVASSLGLATYRGLQSGLDEPAEVYFACSAPTLREFRNL